MNPDNKVVQLISSGGDLHDMIRCAIILYALFNRAPAQRDPDFELIGDKPAA